MNKQNHENNALHDDTSVWCLSGLTIFGCLLQPTLPVESTVQHKAEASLNCLVKCAILLIGE
ncbi:MAG: hypothetical protein DME64_09375 [Verrucomicrobia bacterium]|nr:MAG: hypothetical protein DME64_09375 [Verrucomicrobiota bacterium]